MFGLLNIVKRCNYVLVIIGRSLIIALYDEGMIGMKDRVSVTNLGR